MHFVNEMVKAIRETILDALKKTITNDRLRGALKHELDNMIEQGRDKTVQMVKMQLNFELKNWTTLRFSVAERVTRLRHFLEQVFAGEVYANRTIPDAIEVMSHASAHHGIASGRFADNVAQTIDNYMLAGFSDEAVNEGNAWGNLRVSEFLTQRAVFNTDVDELMKRYSDPVKMAMRRDLTRELDQMQKAFELLHGGS